MRSSAASSSGPNTKPTRGYGVRCRSQPSPTSQPRTRPRSALQRGRQRVAVPAPVAPDELGRRRHRQGRVVREGPRVTLDPDPVHADLRARRPATQPRSVISRWSGVQVELEARRRPHRHGLPLARAERPADRAGTLAVGGERHVVRAFPHHEPRREQPLVHLDRQAALPVARRDRLHAEQPAIGRDERIPADAWVGRLDQPEVRAWDWRGSRLMRSMKIMPGSPVRHAARTMRSKTSRARSRPATWPVRGLIEVVVPVRGEGLHERVGGGDRDVEVRDAAVELALDELEDVRVVHAEDRPCWRRAACRPASPPRWPR